MIIVSSLVLNDASHGEIASNYTFPAQYSQTGSHELILLTDIVITQGIRYWKRVIVKEE